MFNVGGDEPISHRDLTTLLIEIAGTGRVEYVDWPPEKKAIDIGDFYADSTKFTAHDRLAPTVALRDGLARTVAFYRAALRRLRRSRRRSRGAARDPDARARSCR